MTPPQMLRASCHRAYEVLVLKTKRRDKAKLVRLKGAVASMDRLGAPRARKPLCTSKSMIQVRLKCCSFCSIKISALLERKSSCVQGGIGQMGID